MPTLGEPCQGLPSAVRALQPFQDYPCPNHHPPGPLRSPPHAMPSQPAKGDNLIFLGVYLSPKRCLLLNRKTFISRCLYCKLWPLQVQTLYLWGGSGSNVGTRCNIGLKLPFLQPHNTQFNSKAVTGFISCTESASSVRNNKRYLCPNTDKMQATMDSASLTEVTTKPLWSHSEVLEVGMQQGCYLLQASY